MKSIRQCKIDGVDAYAVTIGPGGTVAAEIGFTLEGRRFGMTQLTGLEDHPEVADLAKKLVAAVEDVLASKMGTPEDAEDTPFLEYLGSGGGEI